MMTDQVIKHLAEAGQVERSVADGWLDWEIKKNPDAEDEWFLYVTFEPDPPVPGEPARTTSYFTITVGGLEVDG